MSLSHCALDTLAFSTSALPLLPAPLLFLPSSSSPSTFRHRRFPRFQMKLRDSPHQNHNQWKEEELELWKARRGITRTLLKPVAMLSRRKDKIILARIGTSRGRKGGREGRREGAGEQGGRLLWGGTNAKKNTSWDTKRCRSLPSSHVQPPSFPPSLPPIFALAKGKDPTGGKKEEVKNAVVATALLLAVVTAVAR